MSGDAALRQAAVYAPAWRSMALRLVGGRRPIEELADKVWTVHPAVTLTAPPALYLPDQLDRVTAVQEETTMAAELQRLRGGVKEHGATKAYRLRDAVLHQGRVYAGALKLTLEQGTERRPWRIVAERIRGEAALACSFVGNRYFGHSISDDIPLNIAASGLGLAVRTMSPLTAHQRDYRRIAQVDARALAAARFDTLVVLEDHAQNSAKRARCAVVRDRFQAGRPPSVAAGVLLMRGRTGVARVMQNEDALRRHLEPLGFRAIFPEQLSASKILDALAHAPIVISVEGSQLAHAIFAMREGGTLVVLQPPYRFNNVYKDRAEALGLQYGIVVGRAVEGGFEVNLDDVSRLLDMVR